VDCVASERVDVNPFPVRKKHNQESHPQRPREEAKFYK
jgi:hypothetical protein